jgi:hypothetical protein
LEDGGTFGMWGTVEGSCVIGNGPLRGLL